MTETSPESNESEAWKAQTTAFERVHAVSTALAEPRTAPHIADEALVAENTARDHLDLLVEMSILLKEEQDDVTRYIPDPLHLRAEKLRQLLEEYTHAELLEQKEELQEQIENWEAEYGVRSPTELRECAAEAETVSETRAIRKTASDWDLLRYRLTVVDEAIERYSAYTRENLPL